MFWRYNALTSHIDTLLEKDNVTLHELMDEDDILQECKGQNHKLIEFLVTPEVMEELVKLITCEPSEDVEDKVRYKYPNIACELLTSDVSQILEKLVEDNVLIDKVYAFMLSNDEMNPLLASFFTKVLGLLLVRKADYLFEYLTSKEDFLGHLLTHLGTSAMMDLLMRLVTYDPMYETKAKILKWMDEENLVEKLVRLIHPEQSEEMHSNAATTLCDIVKFGREQLGTEIPQPDPLLDKLECDSVLGLLLGNMLEGGTKNESVITNGLMILQTILEYRRQISSFDDWRPLPEGCIEPLPQSELDRMDKAITSVLKSVKPRIGELAKLLIDPPAPTIARMVTTVGVLEPPLGNTRLQVSRLFATLFSVDDSDLHICLIENDVVNKLLDLFFQYVWNNFLHTHIELSVSNILMKKFGGGTPQDDSPRSLTENTGSDAAANSSELPPTTVTQEDDNPLVTHLFKDCKIVHRMVDAWSANDESVAAGSQRRGYMGHVTKICNDIVSSSQKGPYSVLLSALVTELPDGYTSRWTELVEQQLADTNKRNTTDLVGGHPLNSSSGSDSDSDFKDIPFPQDDTMQQFGLSNEEFGEPNNRFESAFNHQISSLDDLNTNATEQTPKAYQQCIEDMEGGDDSDDDDDLWKDKEITFNTSAVTNSTGGTLNSSYTKPTAPPHVGRNSSDSDSDSSDEELSSPAIIKSKAEPDPSMEIDPTSTESTGGPVAMDTSPWDTTATKSGGEDEEWTAFSSSPAEAAGSEGWADFSNLDSATPASDGGPRVSSPDALSDTLANTNTSPAASSDANTGQNNKYTPDDQQETEANNSQSNNDSLNESIEQAPLSDEEQQSTTEQKEEDNGAVAGGEEITEDTQSAVVSREGDSTTDTTTVTSAEKVTSMDIDEPQKVEASKNDVPATQEGLAVSSEIEITIPTDTAAGGDSIKVDKLSPAEVNGPQITEVPTKTEQITTASANNGPV